MHEIEPYYNWRHLYIADEDEKSPFFGRTYSEFEFTQTVYNYYIHPQWDDFGSQTLYLKILFADYDLGFCIIEFIGEWNDAIENDIDDSYLDIIDVDMGVKLVQSYQWRKTVTQQCSFEFREDVSTNISVHIRVILYKKFYYSHKFGYLWLWQIKTKSNTYRVTTS